MLDTDEIEDITYDELEEQDDDSDESIENSGDNFNIPLGGSPLYPRVFIGDSAKPLQGDESSYRDDNITRTWTGLLNGIYG